MEIWLEEGSVDFVLLFWYSLIFKYGDIYLIEVLIYLVGSFGDLFLVELIVLFVVVNGLLLVLFCWFSSWCDWFDYFVI